MPQTPPPIEERLRELESTQRATFNILEDLSAEREHSEATQRATFNMLEDLSRERDLLEDTLKAAFNILEDFNEERKKVVALAEKEVLLREIHHRVKNNLQIIVGLLDLQSGYVQDRAARLAFAESRNRVKSMALVHETLYQSKDLARLDFAEYVRRLSKDLFRSFGVGSERVALRLDVTTEVLPVDVAIPCGLILSELISNCLKHAFPGGRRGEIHVDFSPTTDGKWSLSVSDDGVGLPEGFDVGSTKTLGLRLVRSLAGQVGGRLEMGSHGETKAALVFSLTKAG